MRDDERTTDLKPAPKPRADDVTNETELRLRQQLEGGGENGRPTGLAREPAPGEADPLAEDAGGDRRASAFDRAGRPVRGTSEEGNRVSDGFVPSEQRDAME